MDLITPATKQNIEDVSAYLRDHPCSEHIQMEAALGLDTRTLDRRAGLAKSRQKSIEVRQAAASDAYLDLVPELKERRHSGLSLRKIVERLNEDGHTTRRGKPWNAMQVKNVLERFAAS